MGRIWYLKVERQVLIIFVVPAGQNDEDGRLFSIAFVYATKEYQRSGQSDLTLLGKIYLLMSFQVANRSNMDTALRRICSEQLRFQVHQGDLVVAVLIYHDLTLEVL